MLLLILLTHSIIERIVTYEMQRSQIKDLQTQLSTVLARHDSTSKISDSIIEL